MFKKTWKQIKILLVLLIILFCFPHSILPRRTNEIGKDELAFYQNLNEKEQRLPEFKDDEEALKLKILQLGMINISRKRNNAPPVKLDILASRVANKMSEEAAENEYLGHWDMAGEEPYLRYAFAGGHDHVTENAYGEWAAGNYKTSSQVILALMKTGHEKFMAERAPDDAHKTNIIDKAHNWVGIGFCLSGRQFRYYEEFIDRYLEFDGIPEQLKTGESCTITVKTNDRGFLYYLMIYRETWPKPLSPKQITKKGSYRDFTSDIEKQIPAWELSRFRNGTRYEIPLSFSKDGLYYIQIFTDRNEITKPTSITTKGKTPESGIVIRVNR